MNVCEKQIAGLHVYRDAKSGEAEIAALELPCPQSRQDAKAFFQIALIEMNGSLEIPVNSYRRECCSGDGEVLRSLLYQLHLSGVSVRNLFREDFIDLADQRQSGEELLGRLHIERGHAAIRRPSEARIEADDPRLDGFSVVGLADRSICEDRMPTQLIIFDDGIASMQLIDLACGVASRHGYLCGVLQSFITGEAILRRENLPPKDQQRFAVRLQNFRILILDQTGVSGIIQPFSRQLFGRFRSQQLFRF